MYLRRTASLAALLGLEVAALVVLHRLGSYEVFAVEWADLSGWLASTSPEDALVAIVRLAALALAWWLTTSTVLYVLASATRVPGLVRGVRWATIAPVRRMIDSAMAATILVGSTLGTTGVATATPAVRSAVVVQLDDPDVEAANSSPTAYRPRPAGDTDQPAYRPTPAGDLSTSLPTTTIPGDPSPSVSPGHPVTEPSQASRPATYVVRPGDNLWTIAEQHLAKSTSGDDVWTFWLQIIEANEDRLRSGNPNLIAPGEYIDLS